MSENKKLTQQDRIVKVLSELTTSATINQIAGLAKCDRQIVTNYINYPGKKYRIIREKKRGIRPHLISLDPVCKKSARKRMGINSFITVPETKQYSTIDDRADKIINFMKNHGEAVTMKLLTESLNYSRQDIRSVFTSYRLRDHIQIFKPIGTNCKTYKISKHKIKKDNGKYEERQSREKLRIGFLTGAYS